MLHEFLKDTTVWEWFVLLSLTATIGGFWCLHKRIASNVTMTTKTTDESRSFSRG